MREDDGGRSDDGPRRELERLISLMIDAPEEVDLGVHRQGGNTVFRVQVADADLGKLIGRQGRTARAVRTLLDVRGAEDGRRYAFEIRES